MRLCRKGPGVRRPATSPRPCGSTDGWTSAGRRSVRLTACARRFRPSSSAWPCGCETERQRRRFWELSFLFEKSFAPTRRSFVQGSGHFRGECADGRSGRADRARTAVASKGYGQSCATTIPVPAWPGFGAYPGLVCTTTILMTLPDTWEPNLLTAVGTNTAMNDGTVAGGPRLFPPELVHVMPHATGAENPSAKPLKAFGAGPPLRVLTFAHCAPQNVTDAAGDALTSPTVKTPPVGNAKIIVFALSESGR